MLMRSAGDQISPIGSLENTAFSNQEGTVSYSFFGKDYRSTFSYEQLKMNYGIPGSPEGHIDGVDIDLKKRTQKFNLHKDISFLGFQTLDIDQRFIMYGHIESEKGSSYPSVLLDQQIFSLQNLLKSPKLHIGSLFQYRDFQAGGFYWTPNTRELSIAVFSLLEREINEFTLQFSSRFEYVSIVPDVPNKLSNIDISQVIQRNFPIISAGLGLFRDWKNWQLSLGTMLTGRTPTIEDLYSDGPHLGTYAYEIGFPTLDLEKTIGLELSLEHHTDKGQIRLTGYQNYSSNYHISSKMGDCGEEFLIGEGHPCSGSDFIEWGAGTSGWLYKYQMQGLRALIYGLETELLYKLTNSINLYSSISSIRGDNLSYNNPLSYIPPDKFLFSTELDLHPLSATLTLKTVLPQGRLGEFETKTDGYYLANMSGTYTISSSSITHKIIFQLDNIFDQEYYNHLSKIKTIMPEKGRSLGIQYRIIF